MFFVLLCFEPLESQQLFHNYLSL